MKDNASVYQLITKLCASIIKESNDRVEASSLNRAKSVAFEILLQNDQKYENNLEQLMFELQFASFQLSLANRSKESKQLCQFIDQNKANFECFESIGFLLLGLKNIDPDPAKCQNEKSFFKISTSFQQSNEKNVYLSAKTSQKLIKPASTVSAPNDDCSFLTTILSSHTGVKKLEIQPPPNINVKCLETSQPSTSQRKSKLINTWEDLADDEVLSKSFSSELPIPLTIPIKHHLLAKGSTAVETKSIPFDLLLCDIKLLTMGIESESFKRAPDNSLNLVMQIEQNCRTEDISDITQFVDELLEAGTCFRRLKTFTSKNPFNQNFILEGFIFKAFCECVIKFLNNYRDLVYSQDVESLLEFSANTKDIRAILVHLTKFLNIHPSSNYQNKLPTGSDFLGILYKEYTTIYKYEIKCFFVESLKSCCQIYFNNFHKWLFHGSIDDSHRELFIYFVDHYRPNTKYFFDKAYLIRKQSVPGFLDGYAENILLCGKYTMLLKSFNQVHPLFMLAKPSLKVCLTNEELSEVRRQWRDFVDAARSACGPTISIDAILSENRKDRDRSKKVEAAAARNLASWRQEQSIRSAEINEQRDLKMIGLREELKRIENDKMVKRMVAIQADRDFLIAADEAESNEIEMENLELQSRVSTYIKLNEQLDADQVKQEKLIVQLKNTLEAKEDALNANETPEVPLTAERATDEMNNVVSETALTEAQKNKLKSMSHVVPTDASQYDDNRCETTGKVLSEASTEAQRNKLKVLGHEFAMVPETVYQAPPVIRIEPLTDLQRNRMKVLSHEFNIEHLDKTSSKAQPKMSLNLLHIEQTPQHLESPMSVTSDHFSTECDTHFEDSKSPGNSSDMQKSQLVDSTEEESDLEMLKAFEKAIYKNQISFLGTKLNESNVHSLNYEHIKTVDPMALSRFLQMSLMVPVNAYMNILNNEILKMFVEDLGILTHLKSLRDYFLMMNGEFGSCVCDQLFVKLETGVRPIEMLNFQSLHMILDAALNRSRHDSNTDHLSFVVQNFPEKFELHSPAVLNMLTMSYKLDWPLNLILNPETMQQYQAIFNYLLKLKRISWVLEECFHMLKELHKRHGRAMTYSPQYRNVQQIRHKMTHFVHCLENHVTRNVLQISWSAFVEDLKSAQSIHCIYRKHTAYLKRILFLCLLNKKSHDFYSTIEDSFKVILKFRKHLKAKNWQQSGTDPFTHPDYRKIEADGADFERLIKYIMYLSRKIIQHGYQKEIFDLIYLIDINGCYSDFEN